MAVAIAMCTSASVALAQADSAHGTPSAIRLLVLNGTHRPGFAARVSAMLSSRGFVALRLPSQYVANAPYMTYATQIYVDRATPGAVVQTRRFLRGPTVVRAITRQIRTLAALADHPTLIIVLGKSFQGVR
jgi:hypothetical protein